jgi:hypothetical protein
VGPNYLVMEYIEGGRRSEIASREVPSHLTAHSI